MNSQPSVDPLSGYRGGLEIPGWELFYSGKVRDLYQRPGDDQHMLMVASDRLSAFDVIMAETVPDRGRVLTHITEYWLRECSSLIAAARITSDVEQIPDIPDTFVEQLRGRATWTRRAQRVDVEIVLRAYLAGSGYREYAATGKMWDHDLPAGLQNSSKLPNVVHTPTTKDEKDLPLRWHEAVELMGSADEAKRVHDVSLQLFERAATRAEQAGVLLADTKFEFGRLDGELVLIDEVLTPDCSRYWPASEVVPGQEPPSYDKEIVRAYLRSLSDWDKTPPPPAIPEDVIAQTRAKYLEICQTLTGSLPDGVQR